MNVLHYQIDVCVIWIYSYSYNYLTRTLFVIRSAMVLVSAPVGPRPVYDSDLVYYLLLLFVSFSVYDNYADQHDIDVFI